MAAARMRAGYNKDMNEQRDDQEAARKKAEEAEKERDVRTPRKRRA